MRSVKAKGKEIDLLAIKPEERGLKRWHVELHTPVRPLTFLNGKIGVKSKKELLSGVESYVKKKFNDSRVVEKAEEVFRSRDYEKKFILGNIYKRLTFEEVKDEFAKFHVEVIMFKRILDEIELSSTSQYRDDARSTLQYVRYIQGQEPNSKL